MYNCSKCGIEVTEQNWNLYASSPYGYAILGCDVCWPYNCKPFLSRMENTHTWQQVESYIKGGYKLVNREHFDEISHLTGEIEKILSNGAAGAH